MNLGKISIFSDVDFLRSARNLISHLQTVQGRNKFLAGTLKGSLEECLTRNVDWYKSYNFEEGLLDEF